MRGLKNILLLVCLLAVFSQAIAASQVNFGTYYALLIANHSYDKNVSGFKKLNTPKKDVELIGGILKDKYGFEVKILEDLTRDQIYIEIEKLSSIPYDNVVVYFSGHGEQFNGRSYWIGSDAIKGSKVKWLKIDDVSGLVERTDGNAQPKHVLIIADSCYASPHHVKSSTNDDDPLDLNQLESTDLLYDYHTRHSRNFFGSGSIEPVADAARPSNSAFALILSSMLESNNDVVSARYLLNKVITPVHNATLNDNIKGEQIPIYEPIPEPENYGKGHIIFQPRGKGIYFRSNDGIAAGLRMLSKSADEVASGEVTVDQVLIDSAKLKKLEDEFKEKYKEKEETVVLSWINDYYANADPEQRGAINNFSKNFETLSGSPLTPLRGRLPYKETLAYRDGTVIEGPFMDLYQMEMVQFHDTTISGNLLEEKGDGAAEDSTRYVVGGFDIGRYEVTQEEYAQFAQEKRIGALIGENPHEPVRGVSLNDAKRYAKWLSEKTGYNYRLPTKAEWLVAAYNGLYYAQDGIPPLDREAITNRKTRPFNNAPPVAQSVANEFGIHGLLGSVWEWVSDEIEPVDGEKFGLVMGGSHRDEFADDVTRVPIEYAVTDKSYHNVGFRLVLGELQPLDKLSPPAAPGPPIWN